ncbi:MAG: 30S ribosomal protein S1 [Thermoguttaceae bacterium]
MTSESSSVVSQHCSSVSDQSLAGQTHPDQTQESHVSSNDLSNSPALDLPSTSAVPLVTADSPTKPKRLIGSQRNPEAYRPAPTVSVVNDGVSVQSAVPAGTAPAETAPVGTGSASSDTMNVSDNQNPDNQNGGADGERATNSDLDVNSESEANSSTKPQTQKRGGNLSRNLPPNRDRIAVPNYRNGKMSADLEAEFESIFASESMDNLMEKGVETVDQDVLEPETKVKGTVLSIQEDSVFLDIGAREQGLVSLKMFRADAEPVVGEQIEVTVIRFQPEEGFYEVSVPLAAADVRDWSQVHEGMIVEARITKTNTGGLECEVNRLRGFIPISQIELFRVEDIEQYVGQKLTCVVEEVNTERRNLVLSRRSMLEREREEQKEKILSELEVGQTREGLVRKLIDAGAFVDLGGVDGFIPIGAMSWSRIRHPSEVLSEGTRITVRIARIEEGTNRISLVYRDDASNPWSNIFERFQEKSIARGKVTTIMEFGAFVELMPGVEGLIHISELSHKRVGHVREVVKEGEWIDVFIVSIDSESKRIGLSIKQLTPLDVPAQTNAADGAIASSSEQSAEKSINEQGAKTPPVSSPVKPKQTFKGPLRGGTPRASHGGDSVGLNW